MADPRPAHAHAAATEGHLAGLGAVPHSGAVRVVAALSADESGDVLGHQRLQHLQHLQAGADRQGEQALTGSAGQLASASITCWGNSS